MPNNATSKTIQELKNLSADQSVAPHIPREGMMGKASDGNWYNLSVSTDGKLDVNATVSASGGSISDGVDANLKATVKNYTNSNPLTVVTVDTNGDYIAGAGGVQYTEGDTDASITGTAIMWEDAANTLTPVSSTKPLPVSASIDTTGLATTTTDTNTGTIAGDTTSIDAKTPALGQALDAASVPVVLTAAQITTLTPPAAITGFATSAKQLPDNHQVTANLSATDNAVLDAIEADTTSISDAIDGSSDSFGHLITGELNNDIDVQFYRATSDADLSNIITETEANGGTASKSNGMATFATTTTSNSRAKGVSLIPVTYTAGSEVYMIFTAAFPTATGGTGSYRRIGLYNDLTDGFFIGYETTGTFGVTLLKGGSAVTTLKASFSNDTLVGGAGSKFMRNGTPEAIDLTKLNVFRIRFGWVGSAPINFEVLSPDGHFVTFHTIKQPNLSALPSINTADLYATCDVATGTSGNAQSVLTNCWGAGTTQKLRKLSDTLNVNTLAGLVRSVITGYSTAGGGAFVNVKANPSGALTVDATNAGTFVVQENGAALTSLQLIDNAVSGAGFNITQQGGVAISLNTGVRDAGTQRVTIATNDAVPVTFTGSTDVATQTTLAAINTKLVTGTDIGDVTINNSTGAAAVNIQDGGNTITVDGAVTTSGTVTEANSSAALTALQLIDNAVSGTGYNISQIGGASAPIGAGLEATAVRVTLPTDGTGKVTAISGTAANMKVEATIAAAQTIGITANSSVNVAQINGVQTLMGSGNTGTGSQRVTIATDQVAVASKAAINTYVDGSIVTLGAKADGKSTATDTTAVTMMQVLKQISASVQAPPGTTVTNSTAANLKVEATIAAAQSISTVETAPTTVLHGKTTVTTAGTRVVLAASTTCKSVTIKSLVANSGVIYVGSSTVASTNGFTLAPGDSISLDIANLNTVNIDSSVNGEGVTYIGVV